MHAYQKWMIGASRLFESWSNMVVNFQNNFIRNMRPVYHLGGSWACTHPFLRTRAVALYPGLLWEGKANQHHKQIQKWQMFWWGMCKLSLHSLFVHVNVSFFRIANADWKETIIDNDTQRPCSQDREGERGEEGAAHTSTWCNKRLDEEQDRPIT